MILKEIVEYKLVNRDIKRFLQSRVYKSMDNLKFEDYQVISLQGDAAREYAKRMIVLLEKVFMNLSARDELKPMVIVAKLLKNFEVFKQIKGNWIMEGWKKNKPTFGKLLSFDINKKTGLITYGELKGLIDYIKSCKDFDKEEVNKYFRDWVGNVRELEQSDYVTLLNFSNREAMSQVDSKKLEELPDYELKVSHPEKGVEKINFYQYNPNNAFEFVEVTMSSDIVNEDDRFFKGIFSKKYPIFRDKSELKFDKPFEDIFKNMVINDADFLKRQIEEVLFREYDIHEPSKIIKGIKILSIALRTPYNNIDKDLMPEIGELINKEEYVMVIRTNESENKKAQYMIIGA